MIEPCPFCGGEVRFDLGDLSAKCESCFYTGPTDDNEAAAHNRLSRIVRAAEKWAWERKGYGEVPMNYNDLYEAEVNLFEAIKVEGGRADG